MNRRRALRALLASGIGTGTGIGTHGLSRLALAGERVVDVVAKKFEFVPGEIALTLGEPVTLRFTAPEVPMGVNVPDFGQRVDVVPGKVATLRLAPDKAGRFTFVCDLFCGSGHEDMSGTIVVA